MTTLNNTLLALFILCTPLLAIAQVELGASLGLSNYQGDLAANSFTQALSESRGSYGIYIRAEAMRNVAIRGFVQSSSIQGSDANRANSQDRNLSFRTNILEFGALLEIHPFGLDAPISPFMSIGASVYSFNPETNYNGRWVELQPLGTEGQGMPGFAPKYGLTRFAVPVGAGIRYPMGSSFVLGAEASARLTFFDHLDDVSGNYVNYYSLLDGTNIEGSTGNGSLAAAVADRTGEFNGTEPRDLPSGSARGNASANDWFYTATITLGYRIGSGLFSSGGNRGKGSRYNRCYQF